MLTKRIIACLDVDEGFVVKGTRFKDIRRAGDPVELAGKYAEQGADELTFLDIGATVRSRKTILEVVEKVSARVFIPLTVGGGIKSLSDMRDLMNAGADKLSLCSAALSDPEIISEGASVFGSQCMVVSIDAKREGGSWHAYVQGGRVDTGVDALEWAEECCRLGAGEILLNSIDKDGTASGYDLELTCRVARSVTIPVIASGGAGGCAQMHEALTIGRADAVLLASMLHYGKLTIPEIKRYLKRKGQKIR